MRVAASILAMAATASAFGAFAAFDAYLVSEISERAWRCRDGFIELEFLKYKYALTCRNTN